MKKYEGSLGKFEYDETMFEISHTEDKTEFLKYIGSEIDGKKIKIPNGVTKLDHTFEGTAIKTSPDMPDSVISADYECYNCADLELSGKLSKNLKSIENAWGECHALKRAPYLSDSIEKADFAFDGCENMTELYNLPRSLKHADGMCANCKSLTAIPDFPENLESADSFALNNTSLTKMPAVNENCRNLICGFSGCTNLVDYSPIPETTVQHDVFANCDLTDNYDAAEDTFEDIKEETKNPIKFDTPAFVGSHKAVYKEAKANAQPKQRDGKEVYCPSTPSESQDYSIEK